ncbi:transcriptional regulator [Levilactobacillus spicheri DSM 15429]|uniref:Transcriptional regulator n=2 Tax=Levilactobacillus spicheri TaxID=216463 RepID=A0A0R1R004_9LACO|nr:transcriptional regulator [Levilactobacillus spicheri DSM 15429]
MNGMQVKDTSGLPYYEQLVLRVKQQIVQGILQPGDRLPSVRDMARQEQLNPNTVSKAYKQLEAQQVIVTVHGKGTYVREAGEPADNAAQIVASRQRLLTLLTEIRYLGVPANQVIGWIKTAYEEAD